MKKLKIILQFDIFFYILLFFSLFYSFLYINNIKKESILNKEENTFIFIVKDKKISEDKVTFSLYNKEKVIGVYYIKNKTDLKKINNIKLGSKIFVNGKLTIPKKNTINNLFNYKKYLYNNDTYYILTIEKINKNIKTNNLFYKIKNKIIDRIEKFKYKEYYYTFLLGESSYIDNEIYKKYQMNGITHLFALSGMHVAVFVLMLNFLLKYIKTFKLLKHFFIFIILIFICFLSNFSPSILRASFFFFLLGINDIYKLNIKSKNILLFLASIFIFYNPYLVRNLSFLLSFTVTYFILLLKKKSLLKISIISFLSSLPIIINNFYYTNILGIINNLLFVPLVTFIIYPLTLVSFIFPKLEIFYIIFRVYIIINANYHNINIPPTITCNF